MGKNNYPNSGLEETPKTNKIKSQNSHHSCCQHTVFPTHPTYTCVTFYLTLYQYFSFAGRLVLVIPAASGRRRLRIGRTGLAGGVGFFISRPDFGQGFLRGGEEGDEDGHAFNFGALFMRSEGVGGVDRFRGSTLPGFRGLIRMSVHDMYSSDIFSRPPHTF